MGLPTGWPYRRSAALLTHTFFITFLSGLGGIQGLKEAHPGGAPLRAVLPNDPPMSRPLIRPSHAIQKSFTINIFNLIRILK